MTLHRALIWGMEKGRGQEALARSLTPETTAPELEAHKMSFRGRYPDSARRSRRAVWPRPAMPFPHHEYKPGTGRKPLGPLLPLRPGLTSLCSEAGHVAKEQTL
jgi:hypothetical protein